MGNIWSFIDESVISGEIAKEVLAISELSGCAELEFTYRRNQVALYLCYWKIQFLNRKVKKIISIWIFFPAHSH